MQSIIANKINCLSFKLMKDNFLYAEKQEN